MRFVGFLGVLLVTAHALSGTLEVPAQYATIQAAIDAAMDGDVVRVAPGEYFGVVTLSGRFVEIRSWNPADPNTVGATILSSLSGSVLRIDSSADFVRVRGLTITGEHTDRSAVEVSLNGMASFEFCRFVNNRTDGLGAAIRALFGTDIEIQGCWFDSNRSSSGAAIELFGGSRARIASSVFVRNRARVTGGAIKNFQGVCLISDSLFIGNYGRSGAVNHSGAEGMTCCVGSTFVDNRTGDRTGSAIGTSNDPPLVNVRNCIVARNGLIRRDGAVIRVDIAHSLIIQPELTGPGLIAEEPDFVRWPDDGGDGWGDDPNTPEDEGANDDFGDLRLLPGSPGIDAGDNRAILPDFADLNGDGDANEPTPVDFDGNPRITDDPNSPDLGIGPWAVVDMGAFEFVSATSLCREDVTGDGDVGLDDLSALLAAYAAHNGDPAYEVVIDITDDGVIDLSDLAALISVFGEACPY